VAKRKIPGLIIERAEDQGNYHTLAVLEYRRENYLVVVDNITDEEVGAYVLDYAQQEGMNMRDLMTVIIHWFYRGSHSYPLSFEFSRLGIASRTTRIYKSFELAHVTRLIGKDYKFDLSTPPKVKRRRVNKIPAGIEVKLKRSVAVQPVEAEQLIEQPVIEGLVELN
jgi:hypothetical protein